MATLRALDLRTSAEREGITKAQQTAQAIQNILKTIGAAEQKRQERQTLDRVATAVAGGATTIEAIAAVSKQGPEFSGGLPGIIQRAGSAFQPSPGRIGQGIDETVIGSRLSQILNPSLLSPEEQRQAARIKGGLEAPAGDGVAKPTKQQTQRDRDLAIIADDKKTDFQKQEARKRLDEDPSLPRKQLPSGKDFSKELDNVEQAAKNTVAGTLKEGKFFGAKAYNKLLARLEDLARVSGFDTKGVKAELDRWWDARVNKEQGPGLKGSLTRNTLTPRSKFQKVSVEEEMKGKTDEELQKIIEGG
jgi:hypothetical protein